MVYVETSHVLQLDNFLPFTRVKDKIIIIKKTKTNKKWKIRPITIQKDKSSCRTYADVLTDAKRTSETAYKGDRYKWTLHTYIYIYIDIYIYIYIKYKLWHIYFIYILNCVMIQNPSRHSINIMCLIIFSLITFFFQNSYYIAKTNKQSGGKQKNKKQTKN